MRVMLSILGLLVSVPALAEAPVTAPPMAVAPAEAALMRYDWAQIFPVTPAFADWTHAGDLTSKTDGADAGKAWLHRDSLRTKSSTAGPMIEADMLVYFNGHNGEPPGYSRMLAIIACGQPTVSIIKAAGTVSVSDGVIQPTSELTEVRGIWYDLGIIAPICNEPEYKARFLARD